MLGEPVVLPQAFQNADSPGDVPVGQQRAAEEVGCDCILVKKHELAVRGSTEQLPWGPTLPFPSF